MNDKEALAIILKDPSKLRDMEQTEKLCLAAVKKNPLTLEFVHDQTEKVCIAAMEKNGRLLPLVKEPTEEIIEEAILQVLQDWEGLKDPDFIQEQLAEEKEFVMENPALFKTPQLEKDCLDAIDGNWRAFKYVLEQTPEECGRAVSEWGLNLKYVEEQTPDICLSAVKQYGCALKFVKNQTPEICMAAIQQDVAALQYVKEQTAEIVAAAIERCPEMSKFADLEILDELEDDGRSPLR